MNTELFAEWLRRQGHRIVKTESSYWYNAAPGVFQAFPYHWLITPTEAEIRHLMFWHGALAVRYSTPFEASRGMASYHVLLREPYSLGLLKAHARNGIKVGLGHFKIEQISFERLATEGWPLQQDTLDRQGRLRSMTQTEWERLCRAACELPGFEAWAATTSGELAAAVIVARLQTIYTVPFAICHRRHLAAHVNNALFYTFSKELLQREGVESLFYTVQSLDASTKVDEFKFRMGFQHKVVRQCVDFHPLLRPFATPAIHGWVRKLLKRDPANPLVAKAEGMLRFYLEGRKPLDEQAWPERLLPERRQLLLQSNKYSKAGDFEVGPASPLDVQTLAKLHEACFSKNEYIPVHLGRPFVLAAYRWILASPESLVLVARQEGRLIGFTTISNPYNRAMLWACRRELIHGYLRNPLAIFNLEILGRLLRTVFPKGTNLDPEKVAQVAFTCVDPEFRGQGVGKALKDGSIQWCRERGVVAMTTYVRPHNHRARILSEHAGFRTVPSRSTRRLIYLRMDLGKNHPHSA
jgi:ribosomal protein S18 acetylase RimI-like enzyme